MLVSLGLLVMTPYKAYCETIIAIAGLQECPWCSGSELARYWSLRKGTMADAFRLPSIQSLHVSRQSSYEVVVPGQIAHHHHRYHLLSLLGVRSTEHSCVDSNGYNMVHNIRMPMIAMVPPKSARRGA